MRAVPFAGVPMHEFVPECVSVAVCLLFRSEKAAMSGCLCRHVCTSSDVILTAIWIDLPHYHASGFQHLTCPLWSTAMLWFAAWPPAPVHPFPQVTTVLPGVALLYLLYNLLKPWAIR